MISCDLLFGNNVNTRILVFLYRKKKSINSSNMARKIDATYTTICKNMRFLEVKGLIEKGKNGREKPLELTEKGKEIAEHLNKINSLLK